ncbi:hypothetical protein INT44_009216 [Umbelopsis vinacea]|uniref:Response regulatory domain-containing protein n=1 Tax=Umbelopsis vinacea TaxID=44442 RepID=A0A8H7Q3X3_9FUNG|nr:hypothetical protein INT44_009216 [Umbelopsis vinacea]
MSIHKPRPNLQDEEPVINSRVSELEDIWTSRRRKGTQSFNSDDHLQQPINGEALYMGENDDRGTSRKYQELQLILVKWTRLIILCNMAAPMAAIVVSWYAPLMMNKSSNLKYDITSWNLFYLCCALAWFNLLKSHRDLRSLLQELRTVSLIVAGLQCLSHIFLSIFCIISCWISAEGFQRPLFSYATFPFLQFSSTILLPVIQLLISIESITQSRDYSPRIETQLNDMPPHLEVASQEIHDVAHMVTSIIEQYAPIFISPASQEYLSSCSIAMPIASTLAIGTAMKEIIHISSCLQKPISSSPQGQVQTSKFDLCELLQSVGDAMEGLCASLDVGMVIYFADSEWKSIWIESNPGSLRHGLIRVVTTLLNKATFGSTIELTLNVRNLDSSCEDIKSQSVDDSGTLGIDIDITLIPCAENKEKVAEIYKSDFLPNQIELLRGIVDVTGSVEEGGQTVEISFEAPQRSEDNTYSVPIDPCSLDGNTDSEDYHALENFYELLKDMKIALYAVDNSLFAKHLTNCLTTWSMNITHFSINELREQLDSVGSDRTLKDAVSSPPASINYQTPFPVSPGNLYISPATTENEGYDITDAKFIIIDDDIPTLKRQIMNRQAAIASEASTRSRTPNRRTKGGFNGRLDIRHPDLSPQSTILFFTSMKNYKQVREIMMPNVNLWSKQSYALAHIVAIPKPACPRRILTALFTAWNKKPVNPQFTPIATLPTSPFSSNSSHSSLTNSQEHLSPPTPHGDGYIMVDSNGRKHERGIDSPLARDTETGHYFSPSYSTIHPSMSNSPKKHASPAGMMVDEGMLFVPGNRTPHSLPRTKNPTKKSQLSPKVQSPTKQEKFFDTPQLNEMSADYNSSGIPKTRTPSTNSNEFLNGGGLPSYRADGDDLASKSSASPSYTGGNSPVTIVTDTTLSRNTTPDLDGKLEDVVHLEDGPLPTPHLTGEMQVDYQKQASDRLQTPKLPDKATLRRASLKRKKKLSLNKSVSPPIQVLIVEDNIINQVILSKWMKNHSIKYEVASNGQEAFDKWSQGAFHLILVRIKSK